MVPPEFLRAAAHPVRWQLLTLLAGGDRQVHELTALIGQQQSLVSYHLGLLRKAALVRSRRSTADGRDTYYLLDLARCGALLSAAGAALHPALRLSGPALPGHLPPASVLFLCTGNSARSQMAEALMRTLSGGAVDAHSAGSRPKPIHPDAVATMAARGVSLDGAFPKHVDSLAGRTFDRVITLCDRVREVCPSFPGATPAHWSIPEPSGRPAFDEVAGELTTRITFLLHSLATVEAA